MGIDIKGLDKAEVLVALYNAARPSALHGGYSRGPMDYADAKDMLTEEQSFSWVNGRAMFVDLSGDQLDTDRFDASNGRLCAANALARVVCRPKPGASESDRDFVKRVLEHSPIAAGPKG